MKNLSKLILISSVIIFASCSEKSKTYYLQNLLPQTDLDKKDTTYFDGYNGTLVKFTNLPLYQSFTRPSVIEVLYGELISKRIPAYASLEKMIANTPLVEDSIFSLCLDPTSEVDADGNFEYYAHSAFELSYFEICEATESKIIKRVVTAVGIYLPSRYNAKGFDDLKFVIDIKDAERVLSKYCYYINPYNHLDTLRSITNALQKSFVKSVVVYDSLASDNSVLELPDNITTYNAQKSKYGYLSTHIDSLINFPSHKYVETENDVKIFRSEYKLNNTNSDVNFFSPSIVFDSIIEAGFNNKLYLTNPQGNIISSDTLSNYIVTQTDKFIPNWKNQRLEDITGVLVKGKTYYNKNKTEFKPQYISLYLRAEYNPKGLHVEMFGLPYAVFKDYLNKIDPKRMVAIDAFVNQLQTSKSDKINIDVTDCYANQLMFSVSDGEINLTSSFVGDMKKVFSSYKLNKNTFASFDLLN